jgi:tetratricopeptide (TPR) repeat protein
VTTSFSDYLWLYKTSWLKLQRTSPQLNSYEDRSLYTTWQITYDRIQQQNIASAKLLKLWAYFDRQDIWFELIRHTNSADDRWIQKLAEDELNFNEAITLLCSFGLVDPDRSLQQQFGSGGYNVHSCVHSWMVFVLNKEWDQKFAQLALTCVASEIPMKNERDSWILQRRLLQHAIRQEQFILEGKIDPKGMEWTLNILGLLWSDQGKLAEAEAMYTRALQGYEEALGPKHISTLHTVNNLGLLYANQNKLAQAEAMYDRALQGYEHALGPELLPSYLPALNTMFAFGDLFSQTGRKDLAKIMYSRALAGYTTVQGPSSKWCRQLEDRLQALQVVSAELEIGQDGFMEPVAQDLRRLKRKHSANWESG